MTNAETSTLVFKDQAGGYYLLPRQTLEQGRVPAERMAQIEQLIAEQEEAQGYMLHALFTPLAVILTGASLIFQELGGNTGPVLPPGPLRGGNPEAGGRRISNGSGLSRPF